MSAMSSPKEEMNFDHKRQSMQVAEISRVLKPGGIFIGSTFLKASAPLGQLLNNDDLVRPLNTVTFCFHYASLGVSFSQCQFLHHAGAVQIFKTNKV